MNKIELEIKNVVRNNLQRKRNENLVESLSLLNEAHDVNSFIDSYVSVTNKLLSEGYSEPEILRQLNEFEFTNPIEKIDWGNIAKESFYSGAKEFAIKWILDALGFNKTLSTVLAQSLADLNPLNILRMFKDSSSCNSNAPAVFDAVSEVLVRQIGGKVMNVDGNNYEWSGVGSTYIGNMFGEAIRKSNFGETVSGLFCKAIH